MADGLKPDTVSFSLGGQKYAVDNIFGSCYNLTKIINVVINPRGVRSGFYRRTE